MEQTDSCQRGGRLGNWMKEGEGIKQKKYIYIHTHVYMHGYTDSSVVIARGKWGRWVGGGGQTAGNGAEKRLCLG